MNKAWYIITDSRGNLEAKFFRSLEGAERFQEENYYVCTGDIRECIFDEEFDVDYLGRVKEPNER